MFSLFKSKGSSRPIDGYLQRYLAATYQMSSDDLSKLSYSTTTESLASRKVTLFRIFDPKTLNGAAEKPTYQDLDDHKASVLFEGRFAPNKTITEIKDFREPE